MARDEATASTTPRADAEITAAAKIVRIMKGLDEEARERLATYLHERFGQRPYPFPLPDATTKS